MEIKSSFLRMNVRIRTKILGMDAQKNAEWRVVGIVLAFLQSAQLSVEMGSWLGRKHVMTEIKMMRMVVQIAVKLTRDP